MAMKLPPVKARSGFDIKWLCHRFFANICLEEKRRGEHLSFLKDHWSEREEEQRKIDLGERTSFDIALPIPARDRGFAETCEGVELFWELFKCRRCGRCCYTPGAGLVLERGDIKRISEFLGSKKRLRSMCRKGEDGTWILKQPCPFYDSSEGCRIYEVRPLTCRLYPLHPPLKDMPFNLAVDSFCPAARDVAKKTLGWWAICEKHWAEIVKSSQE